MYLLALAAVISLGLANGSGPASPFAHKVNVFAADGNDPRQMQGHSGGDRVFAAIGRLTTDQGVPESRGSVADPARDVPARTVDQDGTAFLVSPCYVLTNYHVMFGSSRVPTREFTSTLSTF